MASIHKQANGNYIVSMTLPSGQRTTKSCKTTSKREARRIQSRVDDTLNLLRTGRLELPENVDAADFILSGGKVKAAVKAITLEAAGKAYIADARDKGENTRMALEFL